MVPYNWKLKKNQESMIENKIKLNLKKNFSKGNIFLVKHQRKKYKHILELENT